MGGIPAQSPVGGLLKRRSTVAADWPIGVRRYGDHRCGVGGASNGWWTDRPVWRQCWKRGDACRIDNYDRESHVSLEVEVTHRCWGCYQTATGGGWNASSRLVPCDLS